MSGRASVSWKYNTKEPAFVMMTAQVKLQRIAEAKSRDAAESGCNGQREDEGMGRRKGLRAIVREYAPPALTFAACVVMLTVSLAQASAGRREAAANAARTIGGTDTAHLRLIHQDEMRLTEEGLARGALPGLMHAVLTVGALFTGSCTIHASSGSITGHGVATPHGTGRYQSFSGSLYVTGGTGRYRHIHGRTGLYGTLDRRTFALVVQTTGRLSY
jgi:hypothetical protein